MNVPDRTGFVPADYIARLSEEFSSGGANALYLSERSTAATSAPPSAAPRGGAEAFAATAGSAALAGSSAPSGSSHTLNAAEEFSQLFSSHEAWFRSAAAKRQEVYAALKAEAADVLRALKESEAKSNTVLTRIAELDALIANERQRFTR